MIYLLEDEEGIRNFVIYALGRSGIEAEGFGAPSELYAAMEEKLPRLLLLEQNASRGGRHFRAEKAARKGGHTKAARDNAHGKGHGS